MPIDEAGASKLRAAAARIREGAERLERSSETSLEHADLVLQALRAAAQLIGVQRAWAEQEGFSAALRSARQALESINAATPLLRQRSEVDAAFIRMAGLLAAASGHPLAAGEPSRAVSSAAGVEQQLRELVQRMAGERDERVQTARADFFALLADYLSARGRSSEVAHAAAQLRLQAGRLRAASSTSFDRSTYLKRGLTAASRGIAGLWKDLAGPDTGAWLASLESSVEAVSAEQFAAFQQAALQDAFRVAVDTLAALELTRRCPAHSR